MCVCVLDVSSLTRIEIIRICPFYLFSPSLLLSVNVATGSLEALNSLVGHAITGTTDGNVVVWSDRSLNNLELPLQPRGQKAAIKFVHLHAGRVTVLQTFAGKYIVSAGADGFVRVHDTQFRILAWREEEQCGPIVSLSFRAAKEVDGRRAQGMRVRRGRCVVNVL